MEQPTGIKLCECGCGQPAPIAKQTDNKVGRIKGQPVRFIQGHNRIKAAALHVEVDQRIGYGVVIDADVRIPRPGAGILGYRGARLLCDCGNEYVSRIQALVGTTSDEHRPLSCGCRRYERVAAANTARCIDRGATAARNRVLRSYKKNAQQKNLPWDLTDEDFDRLTSLACFYCGVSPALVHRRAPGYAGFIYNGIDRVDNTLGYSLSNVVTACKTCNYAKRDMSHGEFMAWIARLTEYHFFHPELTPSHLLREVM